MRMTTVLGVSEKTHQMHQRIVFQLLLSFFLNLSLATIAELQKRIRELEKYNMEALAEIKATKLCLFFQKNVSWQDLKQQKSEMSEKFTLEVQRLEDQRAKLKAICDASNAKTRKDCEERIAASQQEQLVRHILAGCLFFRKTVFQDWQKAFEAELKKVFDLHLLARDDCFWVAQTDILRSRVAVLESQLKASGLALPDATAQDADALVRIVFSAISNA